jgi:hypothetical protein
VDWVIERLCQSARWDVLIALSRLLRPAYPQAVRTFCQHAPPAVADACFEAWRIDVTAPKGEDYVARAAEGKNHELVLHFLRRGAKLQETEPDFITSDYLAMFGDPACMTAALDRGARVSFKTAGRWLKGAHERGVVADARHPITARLLARAGECGARDLWEFGQMAASFGDPADLDRALALGWDVLAPDKREQLASALVRACAQGRLENVAFFLDRSASPDQGPAQKPPIVVAAAEGHFDVVQLLLARGADPRATGERGVTALGVARTPALRALLAKAGCESLHREVE